MTAIADRMGIREARDPKLAEPARDVAPEVVMERIEESERRADGDAVFPDS